jgi:hypothetical protein
MEEYPFELNLDAMMKWVGDNLPGATVDEAFNGDISINTKLRMDPDEPPALYHYADERERLG